MRYTLTVDQTGIERHWFRRRAIAASDVRRVHMYVDANGLDCLVIRGARFRMLHVTPDELREPEVGRGVSALVSAVRNTAQVDDDVDRYLSRFTAPPLAA